MRGLEEGADDYLVKPFEPAELVLRVERLISWREGTGPVRLADSADRGPSGSAARRPPAVAEGPQRFGRYEVLDVIGQGSMGTVYRGRDPRLERLVALKTIRLSGRRRQPAPARAARPAAARGGDHRPLQPAQHHRRLRHGRRRATPPSSPWSWSRV